MKIIILYFIYAAEKTKKGTNKTVKKGSKGERGGRGGTSSRGGRYTSKNSFLAKLFFSALFLITKNFLN